MSCLGVVLRNNSASAVEVPHLSSSTAATLRLRSPGSAAREVVTLQPQPGAVVLSQNYTLAAGKEIRYELRLQVWFGELMPGQHEVQLAVQSATVAVTSPWAELRGAAPPRRGGGDWALVLVAVPPGVD